MRRVVLLCVMLAGCSTRPELEQLQAVWAPKIEAAAPIGSDAAIARAWGRANEFAGLVEKSRDVTFLIGNVPARELYCGSWTLLARVKVAQNGKVTGYEYSYLGACL